MEEKDFKDLKEDINPLKEIVTEPVREPITESFKEPIKETIRIPVRPERPDNGMATTAMISGIVGLVIGIIPFIGWFVFPLSLIAIVLGFMGLNSPHQKGQAITGIITGFILIGWKTLFWLGLIIFSIASA